MSAIETKPIIETHERRAEVPPAAAAIVTILEEKPEVDPAASALATPEQAVRLRAVPYAFRDGRLLVAMLDPNDLEAADELSVSSGKPVTRMGIIPEAFTELLR